MKPALGAADREAERVVDQPLPDHLVVAHEAGVDGEAGRVGGGPVVGAERVGREVEDGARPGVPGGAAALRVGGEELVELAGGVVDHDHVAVAVARRSALDRCVAAGSGTGPGSLSLVVLEAHRHLGLAGADVHERDADRRVVPERAEVRVQLGRRPDARHPRRRAGVHGRGGDVGVPCVGGREVRTSCARRRGGGGGGGGVTPPPAPGSQDAAPATTQQAAIATIRTAKPRSILDIGRSRPDPERERAGGAAMRRHRRSDSSGGEARTRDILINSQTLFQLSYPGSISAEDATLGDSHSEPSEDSSASTMPITSRWVVADE